jgi:hypothetical protein
MGKKSSGASKRKKAKGCGSLSTPPARTGHLLLHSSPSHSPSSHSSSCVLLGGYSDKDRASSAGFMDVWGLGAAGWTCLHESARDSAGSTPLPRTMAAGCLLGSRVYLFGGMQQEGAQMLVYNDLWEFDLETREW